MLQHITSPCSGTRVHHTHTYSHASRRYPLFGVFQRYAILFEGRKFHFGHTPTKQDTCSFSPLQRLFRSPLAATATGNAIKNSLLENVDMQCVTLQAIHACITNTHTTITWLLCQFTVTFTL